MFEIGAMIILTIFAFAGLAYLRSKPKITDWHKRPNWKPTLGTERIADNIHQAAYDYQPKQKTLVEEAMEDADEPACKGKSPFEEYPTLEELPQEKILRNKELG